MVRVLMLVLIKPGYRGRRILYCTLTRKEPRNTAGTKQYAQAPKLRKYVFPQGLGKYLNFVGETADSIVVPGVISILP
jgi:hypothetical protein